MYTCGLVITADREGATYDGLLSALAWRLEKEHVQNVKVEPNRVVFEEGLPDLDAYSSWKIRPWPWWSEQSRHKDWWYSNPLRMVSGGWIELDREKDRLTGCFRVVPPVIIVASLAGLTILILAAQSFRTTFEMSCLLPLVLLLLFDWWYSLTLVRIEVLMRRSTGEAGFSWKKTTNESLW